MHGPFTDYLWDNWPSVWADPITLIWVDPSFVYDPADVLTTDIGDLASHTICSFTLTDTGVLDWNSTQDLGYADTITYNNDLVSGGGIVAGILVADSTDHVLGFGDTADISSPSHMFDTARKYVDGDTPGFTFFSGTDDHGFFVEKDYAASEFSTPWWEMTLSGGVQTGMHGELTWRFWDGLDDSWLVDSDPMTVYLVDGSFTYDGYTDNISDLTTLTDHTVATWTINSPDENFDDGFPIGTATPPPVFVSLASGGGDARQALVVDNAGNVIGLTGNINPRRYIDSDTPTMGLRDDSVDGGTIDNAIFRFDPQKFYGFDLGGGIALAVVAASVSGPYDVYTDTDVPITVVVQGDSTAGNPTGTVDVLIDGTPYLTDIALSPLGDSQATTGPVNVEFDTVGDHVVSFTYSGDETYGSATSADGDNLTYTVTLPPPAPTTAAIVYSGPRAVTVGQTITGVEVDITADDATGTVQFMIDGVDHGSPVTLVDGAATIPDFSFAAGGEHTISASYSGDDTHSESTSPSMMFRVLLPVGPRQLLYTRRYTTPGTPAPGPTPPAIIEGAFGMSWKDPFSDVGSGEMSVAFGQSTALLVPKNWIGFVLDDGVNPPVDAATMVIETINDGKIAIGEESALGYQVQGRTHICEWERMILQPEEGPNIRPISNTRYFNLSAKDLDDSLWTASIVPYAPGGMLTSPWGPPKNFPDGFASFTFSRLWERISTSSPDTFSRPDGDNISEFTTPVGRCYVRKHITLAQAADLAIYASADDYFELWVDNRPMLNGDAEPAGNYAETYERVTALTEGDHIISFMLQNYDPGFTAGNIAGLACSVFALTSIDDHIGAGDAVTHTGYVFASDDDHTLVNDGWVWLDYPDSPPGFTPGHLVRVWHDEAVVRGCAPWTLDFTDTHDSAGNPWSIAPPYAYPIGQDGLTMLRGLADTDVDWWAVPGQRKLRMWNKGGKGVDSSATIVLAEGVDLTAATYTTKA